MSQVQSNEPGVSVQTLPKGEQLSTPSAHSFTLRQCEPFELSTRPVPQEHVNDPSVSAQSANGPQGAIEHSSTFVHVTPVPLQPELQSHTKEPASSIHVACKAQGEGD